MRSLLPVGILVCLIAQSANGGQPATKVLIARYRAAACVPFAMPPRSQSPRSWMREWRTVVSLDDGSEVRIDGAAWVGGSVAATFPASGQSVVVADAGDYVYPYDVRVDRATDRIYVVAGGLAGGLFHITYLFEYDLRGRRLPAKRRVKDRELPPECTETRGTPGTAK